ncbi:hypothetical protein OG754_00075 [Streptomyces decoyicus]|uniref:hypothetical protein n=1 Tax=Streptomyces decoyicus TaxID=249567 RepID=UPI002E2F0D00|nr:hypothetical protein [Streptomyces decoyicus]
MEPTASTSTPLLHVEPDPASQRFPVSTASKTKNGVLKFTFSKPEGSAPVRCQRITVTLPVGSAATDLASRGDAIHYNYSRPGQAWRIVPQLTAGSATFVCTPEGPGGQITFGAGQRFTLILSSIPVTRAPGRAQITISAYTAFTGDGDWDDRPLSVDPVEKVMEIPDSFFLRSFSCEKPQVGNRLKTVLHWEGSEAGTEYYLWDGRSETPTKVTGRSCDTHALTDTTTFVLEARGKDANNRPVSLYLSTTVTVKDPDIAAKTVTATDKISVTDTFTADNKDGKKTWARATTFEGDVTITGTNKLTVGGKLAVNGETDLNADVRINAHATVTGGNVLRVRDIRGLVNEALTIDKDEKGVTIKGALTADGTVTGNKGITVPTGQTLTAAAITASGLISANDGLTVKADKTLTAGAITAGGRITANGDISFAKPLFATPTVTEYGVTQRKPRENSRWRMTATKNGMLAIEAASFEWFSDDEKHGRKHRVQVAVPGKTYYLDLVAHGKKTQQSTQGVYDHMSIPVAKDTEVSLWVLDIDDVASADGNVVLRICWYPLGA